jgi:hypothetical protein
VTTGLIGKAGDKWKISSFVALGNNPAQWCYCEVLLTAGSVVSGVTTINNGSVYNSVPGASGNAFMESIEEFTAPCNFLLRAYSLAAGGSANGNRATGITAERLS